MAHPGSIMDSITTGVHAKSTGWCSHDRHDRCRYGPGREFPNGIGMSDGTRYMCSCSCHRDPDDPPVRPGQEQQ